MARSIKSELYLLVKNMLLGGAYTDLLESEHTFEPLEFIKHFSFWNSELLEPEQKDNYPVFAVFFDFFNSDINTQYQKTSETNDLATTKDLIEFTLHLISPKHSAENRETDYLDMLDNAELIYKRLHQKSAAGIKDIRKVRESMDINNSVLMDWQIVFAVNLTNCGETSLVDASDTEVNPSAPVQIEIITELNKKT